MFGIILSEYFVKITYIILIVLYSFTIFYVVLVMTTCGKIFKEKHYDKTSALIPFYNVIVLLKLVGVKSYFFILLFIPFGNIVLFIMINSRLCRMYKKEGLYGLGMFFIPSVFFRLLRKNDKKVKQKHKEDEMTSNDLVEMDSLLSQEEYNNLNKAEVNDINVDNVFKKQVDLIEKAPAYKAKKIKVEEEKDEIVNL